jgi:hypothetical protein
MREIINIAEGEKALDEAEIGQEFLAPRYFHGTADPYAAQQILRKGLRAPDFEIDGRTKDTAFRPVKGRVYLTPNALYARMYGNFIFVVHREQLVGDLIPDEDEVGELYWYVTEVLPKEDDYIARVWGAESDLANKVRHLRDPKNAYWVREFKRFMENNLGQATIARIKQGEYLWYAKGGKAALKKMQPQMMEWFISLGVHVSYEGTVKPAEAWEITKKGLLADGSNLKSVGKRLRNDKSVPTHDDAAPIFNYEAVLAFAYPEGSKERTRVEQIRAISDADAQRKVENFFRKTSASANYRLVSLSRTSETPLHNPK